MAETKGRKRRNLAKAQTLFKGKLSRIRYKYKVWGERKEEKTEKRKRFKTQSECDSSKATSIREGGLRVLNNDDTRTPDYQQDVTDKVDGRISRKDDVRGSSNGNHDNGDNREARKKMVGNNNGNAVDKGETCSDGGSHEDSQLEGKISSTATSEKKRPKKGVVYISRIPPLMNVATIRGYMSQFGQVGRIYLNAEDLACRKKRLLAGGSNAILFIDGWVEFERKSVAKMVGALLNNQPVGGKKRHNRWRDDLWSLRYLPKFKWHHLSDWHDEKRRSRLERKTAELLQMKRENTYYLDQVDKKRKMDFIEQRRRKKRKEPEQ